MSGNMGEHPFADIITNIRYWVIHSITTKQILGGVCYPKKILDSLRRKKTKREHPQSTEDAIVELYKKSQHVISSQSFIVVARCNMHHIYNCDQPYFDFVVKFHESCRWQSSYN